MSRFLRRQLKEHTAHAHALGQTEHKWSSDGDKLVQTTYRCNQKDKPPVQVAMAVPVGTKRAVKKP